MMEIKKKEKILIVGGAGFIGSEIARKLINLDYNVAIFDIFLQYIPEINEYNDVLKQRLKDLLGKVKIIRGDARYADNIRQAIMDFRPDRIIHLAAMPISSISNIYIQEAIDSTIATTVNILEIIKDLEFIKRFVYTSSSMVYGDFQYIPADEEKHPTNPKDIYGGAKLCGEVITKAFHKRFGIEYTIIRPSAVYGPTDINKRVSQIFLEDALKGKELVVKGGDSKLDFTFVKDTAEGFVLATLSEKGANQTFNITCGEGRSLLEYIEILKKYIPNLKVKVDKVDGQMPQRGSLDISKARELLGYNPKYKLEQGIKEYLEFRTKNNNNTECFENFKPSSVSLSKPFIGEEEINSVTEVLKSGWYAHGPKNEEFEKGFAEYIGVKNAISTSSCTAALFLSLLALNIKGEVIIPSFTFVATANAVVTAGAIPVFVDVDYNTGNLIPEKIEEAISPNTRAVICVHYAGQSCLMDKIQAICEKYNLILIEDSAECIGGTFLGKKTGSFGKTGCFSFFPTKNLTTGEGGMITTNDDELNKKIRALLAHGISKDTLNRQKDAKPWHRSAIYAGYNFRMSNILAAIGVEQLKKVDRMNQMRIEKAGYLNNSLKNIEWLDIPTVSEFSNHVYQMYTIKIKNGNRDEILQHLVNNGIKASVHFDPPVHEQDFYRDKNYRLGSMDNTQKLSKNIITLPLYPHISYEDLNCIVNALQNYKSFY